MPDPLTIFISDIICYSFLHFSNSSTFIVFFQIISLWHTGYLNKDTGVGWHFLLQRIFPIQGSNPGIPHCRQTLYPLSHQGSPEINILTDSLSFQIYYIFIYGCSGSSLLCTDFSLVAASEGYSLDGVYRLLIAVASLFVRMDSRACRLQ